MTTYTQLDRYAQSFFISEMKKRGFQHYKTFNFAKTNSKGIHYLLTSQILSSKENLRITPFIWVPEFDENKVPFIYPNDVSIRAEFPRWEFPDWPDLWGIKDEVHCKGSFSAILGSLDKDVIPWFESINNGQNLIDVLNPEARSNLKIREIMLDVISKYR